MADEADPISVIRKAMVDNYALLESRIKDLEARLSEQRSLNDGLTRENSMLKDHLDQRTKEMQLLQGYAVRLSTRLEGLEDHISMFVNHGTAAVAKIQAIRNEAKTTVNEANGSAKTQPEQPQAPVDAAKSEEATAPAQEGFQLSEASLAALERAAAEANAPVTEEDHG